MSFMLLNRAQMQRKREARADVCWDHLTKNSLPFLAAAHTLYHQIPNI